MRRLNPVTRLRGALRRLRRSLQSRIIVVALLPVLVLAGMLGGYMISSHRDEVDRNLNQRGQLLARQLAAAANYGIFARNLQALEALVQAAAGEPDVSGVWIVDADGQPLAQTAPLPWTGAQIAVADGTLPRTRVAGGEQRFFVAAVLAPRIEVDDVAEEAGKAAPPAAGRGALGRVIVAVTDVSARRETREFAATVALLLAIVLIGSFVVARRMSRRISQPILQVARAVQRIGRGEDGVRVAPGRISVLSVLASGFNATAARLEESKHDLEDRIAQATSELLQRKEEAESADRAKTRFLAAASHDLRQPLHALSMFVGALSQTRSEAERAHLLRQVESATAALADLLDALLDISRLDAGKVRASIADVELQPIFDGLYETFGATAKEEGIELQIRRTRLGVRSDALLLKRILDNLVSNAIRYTPASAAGRRARVLVAARRRGAGVSIEVRDNGVGIAPRFHETVFQEFEQLGNPERDRSKGLGLGLAIVRRLARLLDHRIELRSAPGRGSTFSVVAPEAARETMHADARAVAAPVHGAGDPGGMRVLLVEDDVMVRESLARLLQLWGCDVVESAGAEGLPDELAQRAWAPDAVLCDYRLANRRTGIEVIAEMRLRFGSALSAAIVTGDTEAQDLRGPRSDGIDVIYKPVKPMQLRAMLAAMAKRRADAAPS
jgi:signal transduction histidine kinase/CheY-like chemotaxis protein